RSRPGRRTTSTCATRCRCSTTTDEPGCGRRSVVPIPTTPGSRSSTPEPARSGRRVARRTLVDAMNDSRPATLETVDTVYLDHAASTPMYAEAVAAMTEQLTRLGNPS